MRRHAILVVATAALSALAVGLARSAPAPAPLTDDVKRAVVASASKALAEGYIYPDRGVAAGQKIQQALDAGAYAAITDRAAFAARLTADLQSVTHDKHMHALDSLGPPPADMPPPPPPSFAGFIRVDRLKGNIGYIDLSGFIGPGMFKDGADEAMKAVAGADALIIDLRRNYGGSPESVSYLCSFLFDPAHPAHLNDLIWRNKGTETYETRTFFTGATPTHYLGKPVILITSPRTFSGGEEFANDLQVQKRATLVGETTGGGANPGGMSQLGSGFLLFVPSGRAVNPVTKTSWEGVGVKPDRPTDAQHAFGVAMLAALKAAPPSKARAALIKTAAAGPSEVDAWSEASLVKRRTGPTPGHEEVLRRLIATAAGGSLGDQPVTPDFARAVQPQLATTKADLTALGALQSVTFERVDELGSDVYRTTFEHGALDWIFYVTAEGKVANAFYRKVPPAAS
ncbi:MAG TPA: S41 family peptidase [Phenylobacterium sp.]|uniref:S41 family peptidase n=1 Tax=Phenylobacterium sp. TaxID=1871053 RepID=UPI002D5C3782|nr:S41 family peptidase [Phenylobacterium sp.]HZZ68755.1 S41 family peptidase [Phenylobacterium sp.]